MRTSLIDDCRELFDSGVENVAYEGPGRDVLSKSDVFRVNHAQCFLFYTLIEITNVI